MTLSERERSDFRLTRCIGIGNSRTVEAYPAFRMNHCRLLLCSDGGRFDLISGRQKRLNGQEGGGLSRFLAAHPVAHGKNRG